MAWYFMAPSFQEQKEEKTLRIWLEPFTELRAPMLFNLRRDPFEKAQHASNTYWEGMAARFLMKQIESMAEGR